MIENIPCDFDSEDYKADLKKFLVNNLWKDKKAEIEAINMVYKLNDIYDIQHEKH